MFRTSASFQSYQRPTDDSVAFSEIISAFSYALDLTEGSIQGHSLRTCLLGMRIAEHIGLPSDQLNSLYFALLLKDVGGNRNPRFDGSNKDSSPHWPSLSHMRLLWGTGAGANASARIAGLLRIRTSEENVTLRANRGAGIVRKLGMGELAAQTVRSISERWDGGGYPDSLRGEQIPLLSRICAVAQFLDMVCASSGTEKAIAGLEEHSDTWFDPALVQIAVSLYRAGSLWSHCLHDTPEADTRQAVLDLDRVGRRQKLASSQVDQLCEAFADVVDTKSHFTFRHSLGVADTAFEIARHMGLAPDRAQLVRRAGLLHDIGKLAVPNSILNKRAPLTESEWGVVRAHPGITRSILDRIGPFQEIAVIAGEHHEKLDGSGYPHRLSARDLSIESRIVSVADVFGALSEDRPYRAGIGVYDTLAIMSRLTPDKLDRNCFDALVACVSPMPASVRIPESSLVCAPAV